MIDPNELRLPVGSYSLSDDYYASSYDPTNLIERWNAAPPAPALECSGSVGRITSAPRSPAPGPAEPRSPSRYPRTSVALDQLYGSRQRSASAGGGGELALYDPNANGGDDGDVSSSASEGSTYLRHHRYDDLSLAYKQLSDPYGRAQEVERQAKFISESKRLARPFVASGSGGLGEPTRMMLGDCVRALYKTIARDWYEAEPMVVSTAEDLIVVYFSLRNLKKKQAAVVLRYMNLCLNHNEAIRDYKLKKVPESWDVLTDDGHLLYAFRPPWVEKRKFLPHTVTPPTAHDVSSPS